jgi:hypothetical protein
MALPSYRSPHEEGGALAKRRRGYNVYTPHVARAIDSAGRKATMVKTPSTSFFASSLSKAAPIAFAVRIVRTYRGLPVSIKKLLPLVDFCLHCIQEIGYLVQEN